MRKFIRFWEKYGEGFRAFLVNSFILALTGLVVFAHMLEEPQEIEPIVEEKEVVSKLSTCATYRDGIQVCNTPQ